MTTSGAGSTTPEQNERKGPLVTLTAAAAARLSTLYANEREAKILRVGVDTHGCSGLSYRMSWTEAAGPDDETVHDKGVTLLVESDASPFLAGTIMDYEVKELSSGFTFTNPNEKGRCGCGASFRV